MSRLILAAGSSAGGYLAGYRAALLPLPGWARITLEGLALLAWAALWATWALATPKPRPRPASPVAAHTEAWTRRPPYHYQDRP